MKYTAKNRFSVGRSPAKLLVGAVVVFSGLAAASIPVDTAGASTTVVISTMKSPTLGTVLVSGKTVYTLKPSKDPCTAKCLKVWPAVTLPKGTTKPKAGIGVSAAKLGTVKHGDVVQVTYAGRPLYYFVGDTRPGQVHGDFTDTWGKWSVYVTVHPTQASTGSSSSTTSPGTGGVAF